jgi:hypothetical protein
MVGFIRIGESGPYQMMEITVKEMDALLKEGDSMHWPLRFDSRKRIYPAPPEGAEPFFYDEKTQ